uniref:ATP synthase F0 subunit 8 n=1 Tax=Mastigias sp. TaxID=3082107 RepID=A0AAU0GX44_9CNID|nr:ATP synthase F0 subunit 8 [Phyllorhiza punctata]
MPQLDVVTFINQYIWIISSITVFVVLAVILLLPSIKKLIEIRISTSNDDYSFVSNKKFSGLKKLMIN